MIRWTEQADSVRLEHNLTLSAYRLGCLGIVPAVLSVLCLAMTFRALQMKEPFVCILPMLLAILFGLGAALCYHAVGRCRECHGWAEIAIRGGAARWGGAGSPNMERMLPVQRFEVLKDDFGRPSLVAILGDGERKPVLGPWDRGLEDRVFRLAEDMNANLGVIDDPQTAAPSDSP